MYSVNDSVKKLPGVGAKRAEALAKLGITTVGELLYHFPRGYQNRGDTVSLFEAAERGDSGLPAAVMLTLAENAKAVTIRRGMNITKVRAVQTDFPESSAVAELSFFNQPYIADKLRLGTTVRVWGKVTGEGRRFKIASPIIDTYTTVDTLKMVVPVYPLSAGLTQKFIKGLIDAAFDADDICDLEVLPEYVRIAHGFDTVEKSLRLIHDPKTPDDTEQARERFAFEKIFTIAAAMAMTGSRRPTSGAVAMGFVDTAPFTSSLPFPLTDCQARAVEEISRDLAVSRPMKRMLSGDVGSGKTVVAAAAAYVCATAGYTATMMVPTEILAKQHYEDMKPLFEAFGMRVALLTGSMRIGEKRGILAALAGESTDHIDLVIGTHALISEGVVIRNLGLVITDEQHRFGVMQRSALEGKAGCVHTLVMSATPIPRSLTLVLYGDLDISILDELPPGRQPVGTFAVDESYRERLLGFIKKQAEEGHQTYVVCPAVEEKPTAVEDIADLYCDDSTPPLKSAVEYATELADRLPDLRIGVVHGKMKAAERDPVMAAFSAGELDVLVATTVIEVGVNVPTATLMVVENAERFGLSQLHQLRGRVGRGKSKSYCILVSDTKSPTARARLDTMCRLRDGFRIAEEDLRQRGPGDFFAAGDKIKQSGTGDQVYSALSADPHLIDTAGNEARSLIASDPELSSEEYAALRKNITRLTGDFENIIN